MMMKPLASHPQSGRLRLESFAAPVPVPPSFSQSDIEAARAEGMALGRQAAEEEQTADLSQKLHDLAQAMGDADHVAAQARQEAMDQLLPLFQAALAMVAPSDEEGVIARALSEHVTELAAATPGLSCVIECDARLVRRLSAILPKVNAKITARPAPGPEATLIVEGGRIHIDPKHLRQKITEMIDGFFKKEAAHD